jgi:cell division protease FtsH
VEIKIIFSDFLTSVDNGEVLKVEIQGNNIKGVYSNGNSFSTYSPNDPNLIEKLSDKGVSISAAPLEEKMPSLFGVLLSWFPMFLLIGVWIFLCVKCKVEKVEQWVLEDQKLK